MDRKAYQLIISIEEGFKFRVSIRGNQSGSIKVMSFYKQSHVFDCQISYVSICKVWLINTIASRTYKIGLGDTKESPKTEYKNLKKYQNKKQNKTKQKQMQKLNKVISNMLLCRTTKYFHFQNTFFPRIFIGF